MQRRLVLALGGMALLAACSSGGTQLGTDGKPLAQLYKITPETTNDIYFRLLDSVNSLRQGRNLLQVQFKSELNAAAATHSRDMSVQNRPWHFGSDGSSPLTRVQRVGYRGRLSGELISETYETELETLSAWMAQAETRAVVLDPAVTEIGFSWWQDPNGKIWWTLLTGAAGGTPYQSVSPTVNPIIPGSSAFSR